MTQLGYDQAGDDAARQALIEDLERSQKRRRLGVRWPTALLAMVVSIGAYVWFRVDREVAYFFSPAAPITLGTEGDYHFDELKPNRYVQIHGIPTSRGALYRDGSDVNVMVGLQSTPVVVHRKALPSEAWPAGRAAPPVDQRPFGIRGRLLREAQVPRLAEGFRQLRGVPGLQAHEGNLWVVLEGDLPRSDATPLLLSGVLVAFVLINAWLLARDVATRIAR